MNILIIGLGSMGKRRIRLLNNHFKSHTVFGIDSNTDRTLFCQKEYNITTFATISDALKNVHIDCAFICTSPLTHKNIISECLSNNIHVFSELNLVSDGYEENIELASNRNLTLFLSSTALYRKEMNYIINQIHTNDSPVNYNYHVGQYLPDWHPWEHYNDYFIGDKRTNGCRELFAIELPWIIKAFGEIIDFHVISNKMTSLNIDYNDNYLLILTHKSGAKGVIAIDVVSREAVRRFEVYGETLYIEWSGKPDTLKCKNLSTNQLESISLYDKIDKLDGYSSTIIENQYLDEIHAFFNKLNNSDNIASYDFVDDLYTLSIIDAIESKIVN